MNASRRLKSKEKHSGQTLHVSKESFVIHFFSIVDAAYSIIYETRHARSKIDLSLGVGKLCEQIVETRANRRRTGVSVAFRRDFPGRFITTGNHVKTDDGIRPPPFILVMATRVIDVPYNRALQYTQKWVAGGGIALRGS